MSWDFRLDRETGDWVFDGNRDMMGVDSDELIRQRIYIRMRIPRGSFIYDTEKVLGSRAYSALRFSTERNLRDLPTIVEEALEGMDDISVTSIEVEADENDKRMDVVIHYVHADTSVPLPLEVRQKAIVISLPLPASAGTTAD